MRRRIAALLDKTEANGCTSGEAATALDKAKHLIAKYGLDPSAFRGPVAASAARNAAVSGPTAPKPPRSSGASRGRGIGKLAERLIVGHPEWTYAAIATEVNQQIEGAKTTKKASGAMRAGCGSAAKRCRGVFTSMCYLACTREWLSDLRWFDGNSGGQTRYCWDVRGSG